MITDGNDKTDIAACYCMPGYFQIGGDINQGCSSCLRVPLQVDAGHDSVPRVERGNIPTGVGILA